MVQFFEFLIFAVKVCQQIQFQVESNKNMYYSYRLFILLQFKLNQFLNRTDLSNTLRGKRQMEISHELIKLNWQNWLSSNYHNF